MGGRESICAIRRQSRAKPPKSTRLARGPHAGTNSPVPTPSNLKLALSRVRGRSSTAARGASGTRSVAGRAASRSSIRAISSLAASRAISVNCWRTVVSANASQPAIGISSKPTIETCSGTLICSRRVASRAPNAITSLAQKIAVGGSSELSSSHRPLEAALVRELSDARHRRRRASGRGARARLETLPRDRGWSRCWRDRR